MKVKHSIGFSQMSGKAGNDVFMPSTKEGFSYRRAHVQPAATTQNETAASKLKNVAAEVWASISSGYKKDLKDYAVEYQALPSYGSEWKERTRSNFAVFMKMMYYVESIEPGVDLETVTLSDLNTLFATVTNVKAQVMEGWLPITPNFNTYTEDWS